MWQFSALLLFFLQGVCTAQEVTGPAEVSGQEQGTLTVQCKYTSRWKDYSKFWCRVAGWNMCEFLVETDKSEQLIKKNRVSIRDDQTHFIFTVTMEDLRMSDAGIYQCGITKAGYDHMFKVYVNIDPAPERSTTITTIIPRVLTSTPPTMENTAKEQMIQSSPHTRSLLSSIYFLLMAFVELPLLLSMLSAVLWVNRPQRCYGGEARRSHRKGVTDACVLLYQCWKSNLVLWRSIRVLNCCTISPVPAPITASSPGNDTNIVEFRTSTPVHTQPSVTTEDTIRDPSPQPRSLLSSLYFWVLVFLELPLLLSMCGAVLWVNRPQRCSGGSSAGPCYETQ